MMKIKKLTLSNVFFQVIYVGVIWLAALHGNTSIKFMLEIYFTTITVLLGISILFVPRDRVLERGVLVSSNRFNFALLMELIKAIALAYIGLDILAAIYFICCLLALAKNADIDELYYE